MLADATALAANPSPFVIPRAARAIEPRFAATPEPMREDDALHSRLIAARLELIAENVEVQRA